MNWQRGLLRAYLAVWLVWAGYMIHTRITSHIHHERLYRTSEGTEVMPEDYVSHLKAQAALRDAIYKGLPEQGAASAWGRHYADSLFLSGAMLSRDDKSSWYLHPPVAPSDALKVFLLAFALPAAFFFALRWIAVGFSTRSTG